MNGMQIPLELMPGFYEKLSLTNPAKGLAVIVQRSNNGRYILSVANFTNRIAAYVKEPADHSDLCQLIDHLAEGLLPEGGEEFFVKRDQDGPPVDGLNPNYWPVLAVVDDDLDEITIGEGERQRVYHVAYWPDFPIEQIQEAFAGEQV